MSRASNLGRWRHYGARGLVAASVAAGSVAMAMGAGAATKSGSTSHVAAHSAKNANAPRPPLGPMGRPLKITSVSATTLVGTAPNGTSYSYALNAATSYTRDGASDTASDLAAGENVFVVPTSASSSTSGTAKSVNILSPGVVGTVVSVSGASGAETIVLEDPQGFYRTIVTSGSTTFTSDGSSVSNPTIAAGEFLNARGTIASDHTTLDATAIAVGQPSSQSGPSGRGPRPGGPMGGFPGAPGF